MTHSAHRIRSLIAFSLALCLVLGGCPDALADDLVLPASLKTIGESAFEGDTSLDEVVLPEGIESIGSRAFADTAMTHINLPPSLNSIADSAFDSTPHAAFHAQPGTYAYQWLEDHKRLLYFTDANAGEITVDMAVFEENSEIGLYSDPFVCYYAIADLDTWLQRLSGEPVWTVTQTSGPATDFWIDGASPYERGLGVAMPDSPLTAEYEIRCVWDGQQVVSHTTVNYVYPNVVPSAVDAPDLIRLIPNVENIVPFSFEPSFFSFGEFRVGLEDYAGEEEHWFEGNYLHIIPASEGTYTANVYLYAGNMYIGKPVVFRVGGAGSALDPAVEASGLDWYTLTWNPVEGVSSYTVSAYTDEACTQLFHTLETADAYTYVNTDVGTRYWFTVEYEADGQTVRSGPVTADPVTPLPAPENLAAAVLEDGTVQLTWDPVGDVWGYRIYTSSIPEWTLDTEWFSFEGGPGYDGLQVDVGETLCVWVCADNYDGPNERAMVTVHREYALTDEELLALAADETFTLYASEDVLAVLAAQGVGQAQIDALEGAINAYNHALDELVAFVAEAYADIDISLDDSGALVYTSPRATFAISGAALDLISSGYEAGEWISETGDNARLEVFVDGQTWYLEQSAAGLAVVSPDSPVSRSGSGDPFDAIMAEYDAMESSNITLEQLWDNYDNAANGLDIVTTGLIEAGCDLAGFDSYAGIPAKAKNLADIPIQRQRLINAHLMLLKLNEIARHGHPTDQERMSSYSMEIIESMRPKLNAARWALGSEMLNNWYGMFLGSSSLISNFAQKFADPPGLSFAERYGKTLSKLNAFLASKAINAKWMKEAYAKAHELYNDVLEMDSELHYGVWGVARTGQGQPLQGVEVVVEDIYGSQITASTDQQGLYTIEVPHAATTLYYFKDGYWPDSHTVTAQYSVDTYGIQQDAELPKGVWGTVSGTVTDEFGDPVPYATVYAGDFILEKGTWEYTARTQTDGSYSLALPILEEPIQVTVTKAGYRNAFADVTVPVVGAYPWDPVLQWSYGIKGTVTSDEGPIANMAVHIYQYQGPLKRTVFTDENGFYRYHGLPGSYSVEVQGSRTGYVNADLVHENYVVENIAVDEYDNHVQVVNAEMIRARDRYCRGVSVWISANNSVDFHVLSCTYSWGSCSAHAVPTPGDSGFGCYCISDTKDVTVQVIATYEVDGVVYTKTRTASIDLTARFGEEHTGYSVDKNRVISITMGWWYEP